MTSGAAETVIALRMLVTPDAGGSSVLIKNFNCTVLSASLAGRSDPSALSRAARQRQSFNRYTLSGAEAMRAELPASSIKTLLVSFIRCSP